MFVGERGRTLTRFTSALPPEKEGISKAADRKIEPTPQSGILPAFLRSFFPTLAGKERLELVFEGARIISDPYFLGYGVWLVLENQRPKGSSRFFITTWGDKIIVSTDKQTQYYQFLLEHGDPLPQAPEEDKVWEKFLSLLENKPCRVEAQPREGSFSSWDTGKRQVLANNYQFPKEEIGKLRRPLEKGGLFFNKHIAEAVDALNRLEGGCVWQNNSDGNLEVLVNGEKSTASFGFEILYRNDCAVCWQDGHGLNHRILLFKGNDGQLQVISIDTIFPDDQRLTAQYEAGYRVDDYFVLKYKPGQDSDPLIIKFDREGNLIINFTPDKPPTLRQNLVVDSGFKGKENLLGLEFERKAGENIVSITAPSCKIEIPLNLKTIPKWLNYLLSQPQKVREGFTLTPQENK